MRNYIKQAQSLFMSGITRPTPDLVALGDSNTQISYFTEMPQERWVYKVGDSLNVEELNYGFGGRTTKDFLYTDQFTGEKRKQTWLDYNPKYYIICFGLNDVKYYSTADFETYTREMISEIQTNTDATPILMTNVWVDYPEHYSFDRNTQQIKPYDDVKRALASELGLHLIDVYSRFKAEHDTNGVWDTRIRTTDPPVFDNSQDEGKTVESGWFDNIHYNVLGNDIVADEIIKYFQANNLTFN